MIRKIYFMGIKGVGMATLACLAKEAGFIVSGSDVDEAFITDKILEKAKIDILHGFTKENVLNFFEKTPKSECLFIFTGAHDGLENPESQYSKSSGYKTISHGEAVGLFMTGELFNRSDIEGISVTGSHGKTTVTSLLAFLLKKLNLDPSYLAGTSEILGIGTAGHYGKGHYFVAEADEYMAGKHDRKPKFLYQDPKFLIINNIDFDHPDFFNDLSDVVDYFSMLLDKLSPKSWVFANGDDENIKQLIASHPTVKVITFGTDPLNDFILTNYKQSGLNATFDVLRGETLIGNFSISIPGYYNAKNALGVISLLMEIGISPGSIQKVLPEFMGSKRRLEKLGELKSGALVFDDYAHHPEEIRKSLSALKNAYNKKIICIFQAHTFERTQAFLSEFASAFTGVSELIIVPTFSSARDVGRKDLVLDNEFVEKIRAMQPNVKLISRHRDVIEYIEKNVSSPDFLVLTMGAGDVYKIAVELIKY